MHQRTHSMAIERGSRRVKPKAAFTLVELLLTVSLMLGLAGAVVINFGSLDRSARLEEGASHLQTLFRYARAQAGSTGRQVRITFDSGAQSLGGSTNQIQTATNAGVQILWEANPVESPGIFQTLPGAELLLDQVNDLVNVREVRQPGANASAAENLELPTRTASTQVGNYAGTQLPDPASPSTQVLTCYPDGSSDSVELVVASANGEDNRTAVVTLSGLTGASKYKVKAATEDALQQSSEPVRSEERLAK